MQLHIKNISFLTPKMRIAHNHSTTSQPFTSLVVINGSTNFTAKELYSDRVNSQVPSHSKKRSIQKKKGSI
jgi:hypothetical protein